jgi:hypothetical protein
VGSVRRPRAAARGCAGLAVAALFAIGCGGGSDNGTTTADPGATQIPGLAAADVPADCRSQVPAGAKGPPASLLEPPGRIAVKEVADNQVTGFVDKTPGEFLEGWRARQGVEVDGENEGVEGEVYVTAGEQRLEWRLRKVCDTGSVFTATVE